MPLMLLRAAIRSNNERMTRGDHLFNFSHIGFDLWGKNAEDTLFGRFFWFKGFFASSLERKQEQYTDFTKLQDYFYC